MRRTLIAILLGGAALLAGIFAWPATAQVNNCQLAPVFIMFRELVGRERVGECSGPVVSSTTGEWTQPTALGMMTFRPNDLVTAFNDGQTTWLYGPRGLESRPNTSRLPWETGSVPGATGASVGPVTGTSAGPATATNTGPVTNPAGSAAISSPAAITRLPIELHGDSTTTTQPFELAGGDYRVEWEAELQKGNASCYVGSRLRRAGDPNPGALLVHTTLNSSKDRTSAGETPLLGVPPGRYVLDVMTTGCSWKIALQLPK